MTGIDVSDENIGVAKWHAASDPLTRGIEYLKTPVEDLCKDPSVLAAGRADFDLVCSLEVVEHVASLDSFLEGCAALVKPGGGMAVSTINRTWKSYAMAIVGAEYVTRMVPTGTHDWDRFVRPEELEAVLAAAGLFTVDQCGMIYRPHPFSAIQWQFDPTDLDVNYIAFAVKS